MKYLFFILTLSFSFLSFSQTPGDGWLLSAGVNTVNNLGTRSPINSPDEWAFKNPFTVGAETILDDRFSLDFTLNFNGYENGDNIDGGSVDGNFDYFSFDPSVKYYFGDIIFSDSSPFHLYGMAGPGFFFIDESNVSFNVGGGVLVWLNANRSFGIKLQSLGKFALDTKDERYENNHFQHHLQLVIAL